MLSDLKITLRRLSKSPGFASVALITLALGIGACTAMFSLVHTVLLRPLPFTEPARLVWIENTLKGAGMSGETTTVDNFLDWRAQSTSFQDMGAYFAFFDYNGYILTGKGDPQRLRGVGVSQNFLQVLGVQTALGRSFVKEECVYNGRPAALLGHDFWLRSFGGDPAIVGKSITLNNTPTVVVGILPASFNFGAIFTPGTQVDFLTPFPLSPETNSYGNTLAVIGRLKPGATIAQAQAEMDVLTSRLSHAHPERGIFGAHLSPLDDHIRGSFRPAFTILSFAVLCVLLIACLNLSNLLLARANSRRKDLMVRVALGAGRGALVRESLVEAMVLALGGSILGVLFAQFSCEAIANLDAFGIPLLKTTRIDGSSLLFALSITGAAGLLSGLLPALHVARSDLQGHLSGAGQRSSGGRRAAGVRRGLVIAELALACVLLVGAGLLIRSFERLLEVNPGFQAENAQAWRIEPIINFTTFESVRSYFETLIHRVEAVPGVESVGITDTLPLGRNRAWGAAAKGKTYRPGEYPNAYPRIVDYRYLPTMRIPLRSGRYFTPGDGSTSPHVIIINQAMAQELWPNQNAIGQYVVVGFTSGGDWRVVGVVENVRHQGLDAAPGPEMYLPWIQCNAMAAVELVIRSPRRVDSLAADVRSVLKDFDPNLPRTGFRTLEQIVDSSVAPRRMVTQILGVFSWLALALAAVGLYGVTAYSVGQRTQEIGIRVAVGAQRADVFRLVIGEGMRTVGIGIALGLAASLLTTRVLGSLLYGISATDPLIFASIAIMLALVALLACYLPARRAMGIDPISALRSE
jgi:predicted permease